LKTHHTLWKSPRWARIINQSKMKSHPFDPLDTNLSEGMWHFTSSLSEACICQDLIDRNSLTNQNSDMNLEHLRRADSIELRWFPQVRDIITPNQKFRTIRKKSSTGMRLGSDMVNCVRSLEGYRRMFSSLILSGEISRGCRSLVCWTEFCLDISCVVHCHLRCGMVLLALRGFWSRDSTLERIRDRNLKFPTEIAQFCVGWGFDHP
jgi:hypothetical protein